MVSQSILPFSETQLPPLYPFLLNPTPFSLFQLECSQLVNVVSDLSHVYPDLSILALKQVWARGVDTHQEESIAMETDSISFHVLSFSLNSPPELAERTLPKKFTKSSLDFEAGIWVWLVSIRKKLLFSNNWRNCICLCIKFILEVHMRHSTSWKHLLVSRDSTDLWQTLLLKMTFNGISLFYYFFLFILQPNCNFSLPPLFPFPPLTTNSPIHSHSVSVQKGTSFHKTWHISSCGKSKSLPCIKAGEASQYEN